MTRKEIYLKVDAMLYSLIGLDKSFDFIPEVDCALTTNITDLIETAVTLNRDLKNKMEGENVNAPK